MPASVAHANLLTGTLSWAPGNRGCTQDATGGTEVRAAGERPWVGVPGSNKLSHCPPDSCFLAGTHNGHHSQVQVREGNRASSSHQYRCGEEQP